MDVPGERNAPWENTQALNENQSQPAIESTPDIERILAELAGYNASNNASQPAAAPPPFPTHHTPQHAISLPSYSLAHSSLPAPQHQRHTETPPSQPRSPMIDPATIFEWPQALRCVNKIAATNPQFGSAIKTVSSTDIYDRVMD
jgi:hypothetical protein